VILERDVAVRGDHLDVVIHRIDQNVAVHVPDDALEPIGYDEVVLDLEGPPLGVARLLGADHDRVALDADHDLQPLELLLRVGQRARSHPPESAYSEFLRPGFGDHVDVSVDPFEPKLRSAGGVALEEEFRLRLLAPAEEVSAASG
jgi:hypothetical protein